MREGVEGKSTFEQGFIYPSRGMRSLLVGLSHDVVVVRNYGSDIVVYVIER